MPNSEAFIDLNFPVVGGVGVSGKLPVQARRRDGAEHYGPCSAGQRQFLEPPGHVLG